MEDFEGKAGEIIVDGVVNEGKEGNESSGRDVGSLIELKHETQNGFIDSAVVHVGKEFFDLFIFFLESDK